MSMEQDYLVESDGGEWGWSVYWMLPLVAFFVGVALGRV